MKYWVSLFLPATLALAQSAVTVYTTDLSGHRIPDAKVTSTEPGQRTFMSQSLNGRQVPLQATEARVLSESPAGRVTETITRRYDADGKLVETERVVAEEQKGAGGQSSIKATVYRSDLHGRMIEAERRAIETVTQGSTTVSDVVVNRPTLNGTFEATEKRKVTTVTEGSVTRETDALALKTPGGQFTERAREIRETDTAGGLTKTNVANYELNFTGRMEMMRQQAGTTTKAADGSEITEVNLYAVAPYGITRDERNEGQKLKEQQIIVRTPGLGGTVLESTSVRRPTLADQSKLGAPVKISETVCTGKCDAPPAR